MYLVSYDLLIPGKDYATLYEGLKSASSWWHYLESLWLVASEEPLETWQTRIRSRIDENDSFLILKLAPGMPRNGWLPPKAWEWIREHLD
ncbi:MAG: hypothetical protein HY600_01095 [Candidatus Omnitrophica bacterium]|nr:hypothetical protein [Candidatus Omnitrophota bacterium]